LTLDTNSKPETRNPKILKPKHKSENPFTLNPKPYTLNLGFTVSNAAASAASARNARASWRIDTASYESSSV